MESVEELRRALEAARAETAALRAGAEGADRAPRLVRRIVPIEQPTVMGTQGRELMGMLGPTQDKVRTQQLFSGTIEIDRSLNSPGIKIKP